MTSVVWDPTQYLHYAGERVRPFVELLARIDRADMSEIVDLGCGPGTATRLLSERWPTAHVLGVDNSNEMLGQAQALAEPGRLEFEFGEITKWQPNSPVDLIFSNAAFQWVPRHVERFAAFLDMLTPGGVFAFQVPSMSEAPSHKTMNDLARSAPWAAKLAKHADALQVEDLATYIDRLQRLGCTIDAWETTYMQVLVGEDPIVEWVRGSGMRPFLTALSEDDATQFVAEYRAIVAPFYPSSATGTVFPFRRVFVVAKKPS